MRVDQPVELAANRAIERIRYSLSQTLQVLGEIRPVVRRQRRHSIGRERPQLDLFQACLAKGAAELPPDVVLSGSIRFLLESARAPALRTASSTSTGHGKIMRWSVSHSSTATTPPGLVTRQHVP